jgi:hypothetical protein
VISRGKKSWRGKRGKEMCTVSVALGYFTTHKNTFRGNRTELKIVSCGMWEGRLLDVYRCFEGILCLHIQGPSANIYQTVRSRIPEDRTLHSNRSKNPKFQYNLITFCTLVLRKPGSTGNQTRTSGSVARTSDH